SWFFGLMTADRGWRLGMLLDLRNIAACSGPETTVEFRDKYYPADCGYSVPRAFGRTARYKAHCYTLCEPGPTATYILKTYLRNAALLHDWKKTGGSLPGPLDNEGRP